MNADRCDALVNSPRSMLPLPAQPTFPVFGLGEQFDGLRCLALWNNRTTLYTVTLGHGQPRGRAWVSVETVNKTPRVCNGPGTGYGPTGEHDAVLGALTRLVELAHRRRADRVAMMEFEHGQVNWPAHDDGVDLPALWVAEEVLIGVAGPARSRRLEKAWATVVNLPTVAVAVVGPAAMSHLGYALSDLSGRLDQYA